MGSRGNSTVSTVPSTRTTTLTPEERLAAEDRARSFISLLKASGPRHQGTENLINPRNGHELLITVERVATRDYWGKRIPGSPSTFTLYVWDQTERDEYDNMTRLYYNYGMDMPRVKEELRNITGVTPRKRTSTRRGIRRFE